MPISDRTRRRIREPIRQPPLGGAFSLAALTLLAGAPAQAQEIGPADQSDACFTSAERAQPLMRQRRLREARAELEMCARDVCPRVARTDCRSWLSSVVNEQPSIVVAAHEVRGPEVSDVRGVRAIVDGAIAVDNADTTPVVVDPGPHRLRVERAGAEPIEQTIDAREGEKNRKIHVYWRVPEATAPPAAGTPTVVYGFGAVGIAAVAVGTSFEIAGLSRRGDLGSTCGATRSCSQAQVDNARNLTRVGDVTLGAGLLLLACAAYFYFTRPLPGPAARNDSVTWTLGPVRGGLAASIRGAW